MVGLVLITRPLCKRELDIKQTDAQYQSSIDVQNQRGYIYVSVVINKGSFTGPCAISHCRPQTSPKGRKKNKNNPSFWGTSATKSDFGNHWLFSEGKAACCWESAGCVSLGFRTPGLPSGPAAAGAFTLPSTICRLSARTVDTQNDVGKKTLAHTLLLSQGNPHIRATSVGSDERRQT